MVDFELSKEHKLTIEVVRSFTEREFKPEIARKYDREERFPWDIHRKAAQQGFVRPHWSGEYGGQEADFLTTVIVVEELCRADSTLGQAIHTAQFGSELINMYGSEEQKKRYLPKIASGEWASSGAATEPARGSDITMLDTTAQRNGNYYIINGRKTFISNAPISQFAVVLCQTDPQLKHRGQSLIIVERGTPGYETTTLHGKLGIRASETGELIFSNVRVPVENLVGQENRGFYHFLNFLNLGRVEVAAEALGMAQGALDKALKYSRERECFGQKIINFQVWQHRLVDAATQLEAARLLIYRAAYYVDKYRKQPRIPPEVTSMVSMAKIFTTRTAIHVIDEALQVFGGYGYFEEFDIERRYRDVRITDIYEGTTEINRNIVASYLIEKQ
jgi:alkylation response protein AidB-like acyl-CoA dehydrogenase